MYWAKATARRGGNQFKFGELVRLILEILRYGLFLFTGAGRGGPGSGGESYILWENFGENDGGV